jgi:hypothetical protein
VNEEAWERVEEFRIRETAESNSFEEAKGRKRIKKERGRG